MPSSNSTKEFNVFHSDLEFEKHALFNESELKYNNVNEIKHDPWSSKNPETANSKEEGMMEEKLEDCCFQDSFINKDEEIDDSSDYSPLDDSKQYLANLEKKLNRLQGKTSSHREDERKKLIESLAKSREHHTNNFLSSDRVTDIPEEEFSDSKLSLNSIDPQGILGTVLRKLAPEHVAFSAEELCNLLANDILSKMCENDIQDPEEQPT